jgi:hypothetical protein
VSLPGSLPVVPEEAFRGCARLRQVTLGEGIRRLEACVFAGCGRLRSLTLPASLTAFDTEAGHESAWWWTGLSGISVAEGNAAFRVQDGMLLSADGTLLLAWPGQSGETVCRIPEGVVSIEKGAFYQAANLEEVVFPSTLVEVGDYAFCGCSSLTRVLLPEGVVCLGNEAFCDCTALREISLPGSLWEMGEYVFGGLDPWDPVLLNRRFYAPSDSFAESWLIRQGIRPVTPDAG